MILAARIRPCYPERIPKQNLCISLPRRCGTALFPSPAEQLGLLLAFVIEQYVPELVYIETVEGMLKISEVDLRVLHSVAQLCKQLVEGVVGNLSRNNLCSQYCLLGVLLQEAFQMGRRNVRGDGSLQPLPILGNSLLALGLYLPLYLGPPQLARVPQRYSPIEPLRARRSW